MFIKDYICKYHLQNDDSLFSVFTYRRSTAQILDNILAHLCMPSPDLKGKPVMARPEPGVSLHLMSYYRGVSWYLIFADGNNILHHMGLLLLTSIVCIFIIKQYISRFSEHLTTDPKNNNTMFLWCVEYSHCITIGMFVFLLHIVIFSSFSVFLHFCLICWWDMFHILVPINSLKLPYLFFISNFTCVKSRHCCLRSGHNCAWLHVVCCWLNVYFSMIHTMTRTCKYLSRISIQITLNKVLCTVIFHRDSLYSFISRSIH